MVIVHICTVYAPTNTNILCEHIVAVRSSKNFGPMHLSPNLQCFSGASSLPCRTWLHVSRVAVCTFCKPGEHMTQAPPVKRSDNNVIPL